MNQQPTSDGIGSTVFLPFKNNFGKILNIDELEYIQIVHTLKHTLGNITNTAKLVGVDRRTLQRKMNRWQIDPAFKTCWECTEYKITLRLLRGPLCD